MENQRHSVKSTKNGYQLIFKDPYISIKARFYWDNNEILKADVKLKNLKRQDGNRFKLHKVFFCEELDRLEASISHNAFNEKKIHKLYDEYVKGFCLKTQEEGTLNDANFLLNISPEPLAINIEECDTTKPKDKDGSIIVGI